MNMPLALCEERDPKGLYKLARAGKIKGVVCVRDLFLCILVAVLSIVSTSMK